MSPIGTSLQALALALALTLGCGDGNSPPSLLFIEDQAVQVGERLQLRLTAVDADGDSIVFESSGLPSEAEIAPTSTTSSLLMWSPTSADALPGQGVYDVEVRALDGRGGLARQSFRVTAIPAYGVPVIELPIGLTLDLSQQNHLTLEVTVRDEDSGEVELSLTEAPGGAQFLTSGPKAGLLHWKPEGPQLLEFVHRFTLSAFDGSNPPVVHTMMVVLLGGGDESGCPGTTPTIVHTPLADQEVAGPVLMEAQVLDQESQIDGVALYWTQGDPDAGVFQALAFSPVEGEEGAFELSLDPGGLGTSGTMIHYWIEAKDNDDPTSEACDHRAVSPKEGHHRVGLYPAGSAGDLCLDDEHESDDRFALAPLVEPGVVLGRMCGAQDDLYGITLDGGETLSASLIHAPEHGSLELSIVSLEDVELDHASVNQGQLLVDYTAVATETTYVRVRSQDSGARLSYDLKLVRQLTHCDPDALEPNDSPTSPGTPGEGVVGGLEICAGDLDWHQVVTHEPSLVEVTVRSEPGFGDLDLVLTDASGAVILASSMSYDPTEFITWTAPGAQELLALVYGYQGGVNVYELEVQITPLSTLCAEDLFGIHSGAGQSLPLFSHVLYSGLVACSQAPDWFAVDLNGGETLEAVVHSGASAIAPSLSIYEGESETPVAIGGTADTTVVAAWSPTEVTRVHLVVSSETDAGYELSYSVTDPPGSCAPDRLEPNDSDDEAFTMTPGVFTWLRLCPEDPVDTFSIHLKPFERLMVTTSHQGGQGFTDLEVVDPTGALVHSALDPFGGAYLEILAEEEGPHLVRVLPYAVSSTLGYDLATWVD